MKKETIRISGESPIVGLMYRRKFIRGMKLKRIPASLNEH